MKKLFTVIVVLFMYYPSFSQGGAYATLDINNVRARVSANGHHFWDMIGSPAFEVPKGSQKHTIFTNTLWIGGLDSTNALYLSAERYRQVGADYACGPLSVDGLLSTDQQTMNDYDRVWLIDRFQIDEHIAWANNPSSNPTYSIPTDMLEWPAHGDLSKNQSYNLAPYVDVNGNGVYEPHLGDYPQIRGDRCLFFIFNDAGIPNTESGGTPLGIEVHAMAYAFDCPQSYAFDHTIFMYYKVINRSGRDYYDTFIGLYADFDIGYHLDDYMRCDVLRGTAFAYNGRETDGYGAINQYGLNPPAQALVILGGPFMDPDGTDNLSGNCDHSINGLNFNDGIVDNERMGLTGFHAAPVVLSVGEILTDTVYYYALQTFDYTGIPIQYNQLGPDCRFMFPGDSNPCN